MFVAASIPTSFKRFLAAHGVTALSMGMQIVILAWLAVDVLALPAAQVGWVQAANLLPGLAIILFAGALADRMRPGSLLAIASGGVALAHALAAVALLNDMLSFVGLTTYAAALGVGNAFVQPAREKLLFAVRDGILQHTLSRASIIQFSAQGVGVLLASTSEWLGPANLLFLQAGLSLAGAWLYGGLRGHLGALPDEQNGSMSGAIGVGLANAWSDRVMRQLILLVAFNGLTHMGVFVVLLPWMARHIYGLSSFGYGALQFAFLAGTIAAHLVLLKRQRITYPGQGALFCLIYAGVIELAIAQSPKLSGMFILVACWGAVAGSSAGLSRVVLQTVCNHAERGRAMSLYQLALFGMAPLGALAAGYGVNHWGHEAVLRVAGWSSLGLFVLFMFSRALWSVKQGDELPEPNP